MSTTYLGSSTNTFNHEDFDDSSSSSSISFSFDDIDDGCSMMSSSLNDSSSSLQMIDAFVTKRMQTEALNRWDIILGVGDRCDNRGPQQKHAYDDSLTSRTSNETDWSMTSSNRSWREQDQRQDTTSTVSSIFNQITFTGRSSFFSWSNHKRSSTSTEVSADADAAEAEEQQYRHRHHSNDKWELDFRLKKELQSKVRANKILLKIRKKKQGGRWRRLQIRDDQQKQMKIVKTNGMVFSATNKKGPQQLLQEMIGAFVGNLQLTTSQSQQRSAAPITTSNNTSTYKLSHQTYLHMAKALKKNVTVMDRQYHMTTYKDCFLGSEAVTFIQKYLKLETREEALRVGLEMNQHLLATAANDTTESSALGYCWEHVCGDHELKDQYLFYRFTTATTTASSAVDNKKNEKRIIKTSTAQAA